MYRIKIESTHAPEPRYLCDSDGAQLIFIDVLVAQQWADEYALYAARPSRAHRFTYTVEAVT